MKDQNVEKIYPGEELHEEYKNLWNAIADYLKAAQGKQEIYHEDVLGLTMAEKFRVEIKFVNLDYPRKQEFTYEQTLLFRTYKRIVLALRKVLTKEGDILTNEQYWDIVKKVEKKIYEESDITDTIVKAINKSGEYDAVKVN